MIPLTEGKALDALCGCPCGWTSYSLKYNLAYHAQTHGCKQAARIVKKYNINAPAS